MCLNRQISAIILKRSNRTASLKILYRTGCEYEESMSCLPSLTGLRQASTRAAGPSCSPLGSPTSPATWWSTRSTTTTSAGGTSGTPAWPTSSTWSRCRAIIISENCFSTTFWSGHSIWKWFLALICQLFHLKPSTFENVLYYSQQNAPELEAPLYLSIVHWRKAVVAAFQSNDFLLLHVIIVDSLLKVLSFALKEGKVAVHCHAGLGRTGVLIACYLVYYLRYPKMKMKLQAYMIKCNLPKCAVFPT